jgi:hypothetical protein
MGLIDTGARLVVRALAVALAASWPWTAAAQRPQSGNQLGSIVEKLVISEGAAVCEVAVFPLGPNMPDTIIASLDYSGRHFCNVVVRVEPGPPAVVLQRFETWWLGDLPSVIADLDRDGKNELVIPRAISPYEGARMCIAMIPIVYTCSARTCAAASSRFPAFISSEIQRRKRDLAKADEQERCLKIEIARMQQILEGSRHR